MPYLGYIIHVIRVALTGDPEAIIFDYHPFKDDHSVMETVIYYSNGVVSQHWTVVREPYTINYQKR